MSEPANDVEPWWVRTKDATPRSIAQRVLERVKNIRANQEHRKLDDLVHASLYGNLPLAGFGIGSYANRPPIASRITLNVVRTMIGAVTSKIAAKNKPKPKFYPEGGDYELREKSERLERFVDGAFYESGVYATLPRVFRDACVYGTGCLKAYEGDGCVNVERVIPWELVVDDGEALYGEPRSIYQRRYFDRLVLKSLWAKDDPVMSDAIQKAPRDAEDAEYAYQTTADQVLVTEAWHLGESATEAGRHVVCVDGYALLDEEWEGPFPFAFMRWSEPLVGFFGVGLAEELRGVQSEINKLLQQIQRGHHLIAGHYLIAHNAQVSTSLINNDLAAIVKYKGQRPDYVAPQIISPEIYNHLWQLYAKAFEISGISQLNATGMKPAGLNSGEAQRVYQDIQTERFLEVGQAYEELVVEAARQVIRCAKRIGGDYTVRAQNGGTLEKLKWSEVQIAEDLYRIRVHPTSMLPSTPAGKLAWAQDMIESRVIPPEDVLDIVDFPDTEAYAKRRNAPRRIIERNIAHMLKTGSFVSPEPFDNHQLALRLVNEAYHEARLDGVPEEKLELLRRYMADSEDLAMQAAPPPPPEPPMALPPGGPMPPPPMGPSMPPEGMPIPVPPMAA
jgi:hypothetical protein